MTICRGLLGECEDCIWPLCEPTPYRGVIVHRDMGLDKPYARAYYGTVDRRNKLDHVASEYACGRYPANYPMPAIRECPLCHSKHIGHSHFMTDDGLIVPI